MKSIIYTAIIGDRDRLTAQPSTGDHFIAFLDRELQLPPWNLIKVERTSANDRLEAKRFKILPHTVLPPHDYSLWIDGRIQILTNLRLERLAEHFLKHSDVAAFIHKDRTCIYEEAWECRRQGLDARDVIYEQMARYTRDGYPANNGLHECSVILRRNTPQMREFDELWWHEIQNGSIRDQLSFDYVAFKLGFKIAKLPGDLRKNPFFLRPARPQARSVHVAVTPLAPTAALRKL
jgi:hypothetical protein